METTKTLPRTRKVPPRNGKNTSETLKFRKVARQVMLANMFTRTTAHGRYTNSVSSSKSAAEVLRHGLAAKGERKHNNIMTEKPAMKRRETPELFPMSEEMKQTVISLGRLDLLPGEEKRVRRDSVDDNSRVGKKSQTSCKFREKTRQRLIHPQRFIRNVRSSLIDSKRIPEDSVECKERLETKDDTNTSKNTPEDKTNGNNSAEKSDGAFMTSKSNYNILSRPQTTNFHFTAKSTKNQHYSLNNNRPFYVTRLSDLGPFSTRAPTRITSQGIWSTNTFDTTRIRTREYYFPKKARRNTFTGKAWVANSEISSGQSEKNNDTTLKTRRWKSVESLTREIEERCSSWLENRYGITQ